MCQSVPFYLLLPRGTYQTITTSWGANKYHGLTTRTTWGLSSTQNYRGNHISTKCRQSQQDTWLTQKNTACGATASETNSIRGTNARFVTGDYRRTSSVSDMCSNLMWNSLYTRRRIRDATTAVYVFFKFTTDLPVIITTATRRQHLHKLRTLPATCTPNQQ